MDDTTQIRIRTHNVNGFNNFREFLYDECNNAAFDVLALQEHWLRPSFKKDLGVNKLKTLHPSFNAFATSAMEAKVREQTMRGRPYGGTGFLFHKNLSKCIRPLVNLHHSRVTILELNTDCHKVLLINAYMPYFISGNNDVNLNEYRETLAYIQSVMMSHPGHKFILLMDFNCNLFDSNHPYSSLINCLVNEFDLVTNYSFIPNFDCKTEYTRFDAKRNSFTLIDGVLISRCLTDIVSSSRIIHPHINTSDHLPVELVINVCIEKFDPVIKPITLYIPWSTLTESELSMFRDTMASALKDVPIPTSALNHCHSMCNNDECLIAIETFYINIVSAIEIADRNLPRRKHGLSKPYWSPELTELKEKSLKAFRLWKDCGSPQSGPVFNEKIRTNYNYKLRLRQSKNVEKKGISDNLSNSLANKDHNGFWRNWNNLMHSQTSSSSSIDGCINDDDIANAFTNSYKKVYTKSDADRALRLKFNERYNSNSKKFRTGIHRNKCVFVRNFLLLLLL